MGYWKVRWVVLSAIQLRFGSMVQDYMNTVCGFLDNVNGNGGKKLGDSTVYGSSTTTATASSITTATAERLIEAQTGLLVGYSFYGSFSKVKGNNNNTGKF